MAKDKTSNAFRKRCNEALVLTLTRFQDFQKNYPTKFEGFLNAPEIQRMLKNLNSFL